MAFRILNLIAALLFVLISLKIELSTCQALKGKVSCLDCKSHYNFSGIKVLVRCDKVKKLSMATAKEDGSFVVDLPSQSTKAATPMNCLAKLIGGPSPLYASKENMVSQIVKAGDDTTATFYTFSTLAFSTKCPPTVMKCGFVSKTVDLPLPPEWGLAPSSYYVPFVPIIGVP